MKFFCIIFTLLTFSACAQTLVKKIEVDIFPGEARLLEVENPGGQVKFFCRDKEQKVMSTKDKILAVVVESYFSTFQKFSCKLVTDGKMLYSWQFFVKSKKFPSEKLRVDPKKIKLSEKDQNRVIKEQEVLDKIYASSDNILHISKAFIKPLDSQITSFYGIRRIYNNQKQGQHLGVDFRANVGIKVPATNKGKIVFSGDLFYTGGTVIIDHGLEMFSVYGHLSETFAQVGDIVERGDIIGLSGNTGRSSGPHLHWGVKIQGQYVDGISLIEETKKILNE